MIAVRRSERDGVWWALDVTRDQQVVGKWSRNVGHLIAEITRANKADAFQAAILEPNYSWPCQPPAGNTTEQRYRAPPAESDLGEVEEKEEEVESSRARRGKPKK